jgi:hypothetical protein
MYNLPKNHVSGRIFFGAPNSEFLSPDRYFVCMKLLKNLFESHEFKDYTPGFYINYIKDKDIQNGSLRLNYYTTNASKTIETIESFSKDKLKNFILFRREHADQNKPKEEYNDGGNEEELRFRNFLNVNTRIVIDLVDNFDTVLLQALVFCYRHYWLATRTRPELVLEPILDKYSAYFNKMKKVGLNKNYWQDLIRMHSKGSDPRIELHYLVNMMAFPFPDTNYDIRFFDDNWFK